MTKVALELPAVIVTLGGKVAFVELLESFTTKPPAGAGPFLICLSPPATGLGEPGTEAAS